MTPTTLTGEFVRLEPLTLAHADALADVGLDPDLWRLMPKLVKSRSDMFEYVEKALDELAAGASLPFAIVWAEDGTVIGSTRYMDIALEHKRLEIGCTWLTPRFQRTAANTEAKLLLLEHAFERLDLNRVIFKTDMLNEASRQAISRLGAVEEGVFRKHIIAETGRVRDMVYFSILASEWPSAKARLLQALRPKPEPV